MGFIYHAMSCTRSLSNRIVGRAGYILAVTSNSSQNSSIRLICPTTSDLGTVSKGILDRIISSLTLKLGYSLWQCTVDVITWFDGRLNKWPLSFIQFNIANDYASIYTILLNKDLIFARGYVNVSDQVINFIPSTRKTPIKYNDILWQKGWVFDVTMGASDSADLVGLYILWQIKLDFLSWADSLYRDDTLFVVQQRSKNNLCNLDKPIRRYTKEYFNLGIVFNVYL